MSRLTKWLDDKKAICIKECEKECVDGNEWCPKCKPLTDVLIKLADYEDKQEQGLLIELPVPLGTEVYKVVEDKTTATIETIKHNGHEYHRTISCYFVCRDLFTFSMLNEVGKTVFLTLDEARKAEEALAKMGGK